jgi:hypothetical protein
VDDKPNQTGLDAVMIGRLVASENLVFPAGQRAGLFKAFPEANEGRIP